MKKNILLTLLMSLSLTSCIVIENPSSNENSSNQESSNIENSSTIKDSTNNENSSLEKETSSNEESSTDDNVSVDPTATKIELGYGDYVSSVNNQYKGETLYNKYTDLTKEVESSQNGIIKTKYQKGLQEFFNIDNKVSINIDVTKNELLKINECHSKGNEESYRVCDVNITINDLLFHYEDVGIRLKGNTSRGYVVNEDGSLNLRHYKLNFAETFDDEFRGDVVSWTDEDALAYREDRTFFGLEKVDIRWNKNQEKTYIREYYAYEMYRNNGLLAPHTNPLNLSFNIEGNTQNAGVYLAVEPIDKDFMKRNLAKEYRDGDLYKMGWTNVGATLDSTNSNLFGVENQVAEKDYFVVNKFPYDLKTNKKTSNHEDIKNFIKLLNNTSYSKFKSMLEENTKYDMLMKYFAVSFLLGDPDDLRGNFNNTYLYFIPKTESSNALAVFIPTDHDRVLGSSGGANPSELKHTVELSPFATKTGYSTNNMPLYKKSIFGSDENIKDDYLNAIKEVVDSSFMSVDTFKSYYDKAYNHYGNLTTLGDKYKDSDVNFSLKENDDINNGWNLSIETYLTKKLKTVSSYIGIEVPSDPIDPTPIDPSSYDIIFHYYSNELVYADLDLWIWSRNEDGKAYDWSGTDEFGAYYYINSSTFASPNDIGIIVRTKGSWNWQTSSKYFDKSNFDADSEGITHIYAINQDNNLLLYKTPEEAKSGN